MTNNQRIILLIDDDPITHFISKRLLNAQNIPQHIEVCITATAAWAYIETCLLTGTLPDIIFLDLEMPGMNGRQFLEKCEHAGVLKHSKVILLSIAIQPEDLDLCLKYHIEHHIGKPLTHAKLENIKMLTLVNNGVDPLEALK